MYWLTGLLGLAAILAPYAFGYQNEAVAFWATIGAGAALMGLAILEGLERDRDELEYWVAGVVGIGAITAPFLPNFHATTTALWTVVGIGILALITAGYRILAPPPA